MRLFIGVSSWFVGQYDFSTIIYWQFGSSVARPVSWREGKMNLMGPSKNIICIIYFCLSAISLLLEVAGNMNAYV